MITVTLSEGTPKTVLSKDFMDAQSHSKLGTIEGCSPRQDEVAVG